LTQNINGTRADDGEDFKICFDSLQLCMIPEVWSTSIVYIRFRRLGASRKINLYVRVSVYDPDKTAETRLRNANAVHVRRK